MVDSWLRRAGYSRWKEEIMVSMMERGEQSLDGRYMIEESRVALMEGSGRGEQSGLDGRLMAAIAGWP